MLSGCRKATVSAPVAETNTEKAVSNTNNTPEEEKAQEVPEEWKGKTIKDILEPTVTENGTINESKISEAASNPSYDISQGTYIIEARKTLSGMVFFPKDIIIKTGETIRWVNALEYLNRTARITIYSYLSGIFRSDELNYGEYFEHTFDEKGNFTYNALPYQAIFKRGTVVVK